MIDDILGSYISIIIRTKNEERFIGHTLSAIFQQEIEIPYEVIVIDSGSTDRTHEIIDQFRTCFYEIQSNKFTFGYALNYGARLANGSYIINLSAHCIPVHSSWMKNILEPLRSDSSIAATFGKQEPIRGLNPLEEQMLIADFRPDKYGNIKPIFSNANCAIRKSILKKHPFDERASFAEDFLWARRLPSEYGIRYVDSASVYHSHPLTFSYWAKRYYDSGLAKQYLETIYGFKYTWGNQQSTKMILKNTIKEIKGILYSLKFLIKHRYYPRIPLLPIYTIIRLYFYNKGISEGRKIYRYLESQSQ